MASTRSAVAKVWLPAPWMTRSEVLASLGVLAWARILFSTASASWIICFLLLGWSGWSRSVLGLMIRICGMGGIGAGSASRKAGNCGSGMATLSTIGFSSGGGASARTLVCWAITSSTGMAWLSGGICTMRLQV